jgi:hypothetical protein
MRPIDTFTEIKEGGELSYIFWAHFCALVKNDIKKKQDHLPMDIAAFQSVSIIEPINGYYRAIALKRREVEMAFRTLEGCLAKPPYLYPMGIIINFADSKGKNLLGQYTAEELESWLKKQTTESKTDELPALFIFKSSTTNDRCFILKDRLLPFCIRLLAEARLVIGDVILKQWSRMLLEYKNDTAMENDDQFERELFKIARKLFADLMTLLTDPRLLFVYQEAEKSTAGVPPVIAIFKNGVLLPYSSVFLINRKDIAQKAKNVLPFWYSMPIFFAIIGFFKRLLKKREHAKYLRSKEMDDDEDILEENTRSSEIKAAALDLELFLLPAGHTLDSYMEQLEDRWSRLIDRKAREHLVQDVQFLARDNLRRILRIQKQFKPTHEAIKELAFNLVVRNKALSSLSARDSLLLYLELYMIKLLGNVK